MTGPKPVVLFNCATNIVGGAIKNSALFIRQSVSSADITFYYAVSPEVNELLVKWQVDTGKRLRVFKESPSRSKNARRDLLAYAAETGARLVYTMAGPAYVRFPVTHVMGLSNAYLTHADLQTFRIKGNTFKVLRYLAYVGYQLFKSLGADFYIFQTEEARVNYAKRTFIKLAKTAVVSNAFDEEMVKALTFKTTAVPEPGKPFRIFCPGAHYLHKGLQFIPAIAGQLAKITPVRFEFVVSLNEGTLLTRIMNEARAGGVDASIKTVGEYKYSEMVELYKQADLIFVPSLLETFSATYLEAMAARKPLVVADKGFSRGICLDAAAYVNPLKPAEAAEAIKKAMEVPGYYNQMIDNGSAVLLKYGNHNQRYLKIEKILLDLLSKVEEN